ncbi:hypothetical protein SODALDRAFT_353027 [Sodiomyces alkalinus F11]|uniref:Kinetochore protein fta4 n=1 Tax=Sodiomyces alkalinus (strain CBS 110278 / VKM F-3762 / F11) TaxID=1314773 RepID=A0A3N2PL93_SODAK|nr:hypothetical protein SODALDRAFT_353027 [Sodiomyces alkalinus F11]ROT35293.1 hypothetical protein SODALDRAFT_353027 [Sodiomyces alkalinus F11]
MASRQDPLTVTAIKQSFIDAQTRLLSQPPRPSGAWRAHNAASEDPLPGPALDDALLRLDQTIAQHARRVYPPQSTRLVAEQIDRLYQTEAERRDRARDASHDELGVPSSAADLTSDEILSSLPATWPIPKEAESLHPQAKRYADLAARLSTLADARSQARARLARLRRAHAALRPFAAPADDHEAAPPTAGRSDGRDHGNSAIQQNLVTRDGDVERELARMRLLLARVSGRVAALPSPLLAPAASSTSVVPGDDVSMEMDFPAQEESRKVDELLGRF